MKKMLFPLKPDLRKKEERIILSVVNNLFSVSLISLMTVLVGTILDGLITIRLRDDCKAFDATRRDAIMHPEDNLSNVGIRILNSIAKDINYYSTLDMNYLTMHIRQGSTS